MADDLNEGEVGTHGLLQRVPVYISVLIFT